MASSHVRVDGNSRRLVAQIVDHVKAQGIFDQFRRDCMEELERKVGMIHECQISLSD